MNPVRLAVAGLGRWGTTYLTTLAALPGAQVVAGADPDPQARARAIAAGLVSSAVASVDEALGGADAIILATPSATHAALALRTLAARVPTLVEKPLATDPAAAAQVMEAAAVAGAPLLVGHLTLHHPATERLLEIVASGELGAIRRIVAERSSTGRTASDNVIWALGPHDVAAALSLAPGGAELARVSEPAPGEARIELRLGPATAVLRLVRRPASAPVRTLTVAAERGSAQVDEVHGTVTVRCTSGASRVERPDFEPPLFRQCRHFLECVRGRAIPRPDPRVGVEVVRLLAEAQARLTRSRGVDVLNACLSDQHVAPDPA